MFIACHLPPDFQVKLDIYWIKMGYFVDIYENNENLETVEMKDDQWSATRKGELTMGKF